MKAVVDVAEVEKLLAGGAQIVEVLPRAEYEEMHLPGALSIPLAELPARADELVRDRPVVVYCWDLQCDLSPRAAAWLVQLGFAEVYDFMVGKAAWMGSGLPTEGTVLDTERAGYLAGETATCALDDDLASIADRVTAEGLCVVVDGDGVVLGAVRPSALELPPDSVVADVMRAGPRTIRPDTGAEDVRKIFEGGKTQHVIVTTLAGELLGVIHRQDVMPAR